jgi:hypothetical protein
MSLRRLVLPSPADGIFLILLLGIPLGWSPAILNTDGDAARHLRVGGTILDRGGLFYTDLFSHTMAGQPFVPYEWLSEVLFAGAHRIGGLPAVVALTALVLAASYGLLALFLQRRGVDPLLAFAVTSLAALAGAFHWLARPHVFTILGTIALLMLLERSGKGTPWLVAVLFVFWTNLHGGFLFGLTLIGFYLIGDALEVLLGPDRAGGRERLRTHGLALAAALLGACVNPSGPGLFAHVVGYLGKSYLVDNTNEYRSPDFHLFFGKVFLVLLVGLIGGLALSRRRPSWHAMIVLLGTLAFALHSARNIPLFTLTAVPLVTLHLDPEWRALRLPGLLGRLRAGFAAGAEAVTAGPWSAIGALILLVLAAGGFGGVWPKAATRFDPMVFPVEAVQRARDAGLEGRMYNSFIWGGYILFAWPEQRVFIDGQTDFYGERLTRTYSDIMRLAPGWRDRLAEKDIDLVIVSPRAPLAGGLTREPGWSTWHRDSTAVIFLRSAPGSAGTD